MKTQKKIRLNSEYSQSEIELMRDSFRVILERARKGLAYLGSHSSEAAMPSSAAVCMADIKETADWDLLDSTNGGLKLKDLGKVR